MMHKGSYFLNTEQQKSAVGVLRQIFGYLDKVFWLAKRKAYVSDKLLQAIERAREIALEEKLAREKESSGD